MSHTLPVALGDGRIVAEGVRSMQCQSGIVTDAAVPEDRRIYPVPDVPICNKDPVLRGEDMRKLRDSGTTVIAAVNRGNRTLPSHSARPRTQRYGG